MTGFETAQRKLAKIRAFREAGVPRPSAMRKLDIEQRRRWRPIISQVEAAHPLVDRTDAADKGGRFIMSLCEGEMLWMRHKGTGDVGYFVVAKIDRAVWLVPHWDARPAGERKDAEGKRIRHSKRDQFSATPTDLQKLAPPGEAHARKVRVSALGEIAVLEGD